MKKFVSAILITFLGSIFVFSQTGTNPTADWKIFAPADEEISVETPVALNKSSFMNSEENSRYLNSISGTYYFLFSDSLAKDGQCRIVKQFAVKQGQNGTRETVGDVEIEKFFFSDETTYYHKIFIIRTKNRCYALQTVSPWMENQAVGRFFKSLKLNNVALKTVEPTEEKAVNITIKPEVPEVKQAVKVDGKGSGGSGIGTGGGVLPIPETKPTPLPTGLTAGVKILTKPRVNYTDLARFYEINGKVVLRVTFSANGTVGAISLISKLPFGLTEQAIAAARGITFEPAMRNGTPYSVTKPVEYTFTLF